MVIRKTKTRRTRKKWLTPTEREICRKIAPMKAGLASQRAAALLAIDEGVTRAEVAKQTGLRTGQLHYLLTRFRLKHLSIFPEDMIGKTPKPAIASTKAKSKPKKETVKKPKKDKKTGKKDKKEKTKKKKKKKAKSKKKIKAEKKIAKGKKSKKGKGKSIKKKTKK
jgi:hypothetical protein